MDLQAAEKATRNGATAGFVSAGLTLAVVAFAVFGGSSGEIAIWNDPWNFIDVALMAGLSFGVLRKSRSAALLLFLYFTVSKIYIVVETGRPTGIWTAAVFLYFFGKAIQGSFAYHRIRRDEDPGYRPAARWHYFVWPPVALFVLATVLLGLSSVLHLTPSTAVVRGEDLHQRETALLVSKGLIEAGESVVVFYSEGVFSIGEGGNILTERRVISYEESDGRLLTAAADYGEIANVAVEQRGDFLSDTVISVATDDGRVFRLLASTEAEGDQMFMEELRERWQAARK